MSQSVITNGNIEELKTDKNEKQSPQQEKKSDSATSSQPTKSNHEPNVRHIPIFVEGRDEPLYNRNIETSVVDSPISRPAPTINDIPQHGSLFNRCKDIPVKKVVPEFHAANFRRSESPARTIPINVIHTQTNKSQPQQASQQQNREPQQRDQRSQSPRPPSQPIDPITKIQNIQTEVLELMEKVEHYKGGSRKDKNYVYLDEMLTQNLLKLDTIDTEGKENIKAARKEAINCINKCIQVLEAKADAAEKPESLTDQNKSDNQQQNKKMYDNSTESNNDKSN